LYSHQLRSKDFTSLEERLAGVGACLFSCLAEAHVHSTSDIFHSLPIQGTVLEFKEVLGKVRGGFLPLEAIEGDVGTEEGGLIKGDHTVYLLYHHSHLQVELKKSKVDHIMALGEVSEEELLRRMIFVLTKEAHHVGSERGGSHLRFLRCQREVVQEIMEMVGDEEVHFCHEAISSIHIHRRKVTHQALFLLLIFYPLKVTLREGHREGVAVQVVSICIEEEEKKCGLITNEFNIFSNNLPIYSNSVWGRPASYSSSPGTFRFRWLRLTSHTTADPCLKILIHVRVLQQIYGGTCHLES